MRAVVFDLDNTLYPEAEFVAGGFRAAAAFLSDHCGVDATDAHERFVAALEVGGRSGVFDRVVADLGLDVDPRLLVYLYRTHAPSVALFPDARAALARLRGRESLIAVLTDGMGSVQRRKIAALGLEPDGASDVVDFVVVTDEIGPEAWKPCPLPFEIVLYLLDVPAGDCAYIGDDASKDFGAPNALGMVTVMVDRPLKWSFGGPAPSPESEARHVVADVMEAMEVIGL